MKLTILFAALLLLFPALVLADSGNLNVTYSFSITNAPGGIGDVSWSVTDLYGFVADSPFGYLGTPGVPPAQMFDSHGNVIATAPFLMMDSASSSCSISGVQITGGGSLTTFFSPLCNGLYDSLSAGFGVPPDTLGTWSWWGTNPDGTKNYDTLTISDPPMGTMGVPEPSTLALVGIGMVGLAFGRKLITKTS